MNRRTLLGRFAASEVANRTAGRLDYYSPLLEPLEERQLLSAVTWNVDQTLSSVTLAIPDQPFTYISGSTTYSGTVRIRNDSGSSNLPWTSGNHAAIGGTLATDYTDGSSIQFLSPQAGLVGENSGSYRPPTSAWNGTNFGGTTASGPGVFGAQVYASIAQIGGITVGLAYVNFTGVNYDLGSTSLPITAGTYHADSTNVGISSALINAQGESVIFVGQLVPDTQATVTNLEQVNQSPTGTITSPNPITQPNERELTFPILQNLSIVVSGQTLHGTITGQIVATTTLEVPPVVAAGSSSTWTNAGPVTLAGSGTVTTSGGANITSMTVGLNSPQAGDVLSATSTPNITVTGSGTTSLTLTGSDTAADYQTLLQSITYTNTNGGPGVPSETANIVATDQFGGISNTAVATVNINVSPILLLNPPSANNAASWTNSGAVSLANAAATITDGESGNLTGMTATIVSPAAGDVLSANTTGTSIVAAYAGGVLTLSGTDTVADYQTVLRTIQYNNTLGGPGVPSETVNVVGTDGTNSSNTGVATVNVNVAPVVLLNPPSANSTATWTNLGPGSGPVAIANALTASITDGESGSLTGLTATIASPQAGDVLAANTSGTAITAGFAGGVLTLSGTDTLANYQQVLRTITYNNTAGGPGVPTVTVNVAGTDGTNSSNIATSTITINIVVPSSVAGRHLFYNQSKFDGNTAGVSTSDDNAVAPDKTAYLPGGGATTFSNLSSFSKGLNGIDVDISGSHGTITAADFTFKVGANNTPSTWATAPAPTTVSVRAGAGTGGSDRVELIWANNAIQNNWLEVITKADANTNLPQLAGNAAGVGDIFFFGDHIGDTGLGNSASFSVTSATDEVGARNNQGVNQPITNIYDFDRNGIVNATDQLISRNNAGNLRFVNIANPPAAPAGDSGVASGLAALGSTSTSPKVGLPAWASLIGKIDLNSGPVANILQQLAKEDTKLTRSILVAVDNVADELGVNDDLLDSLLSDLGLE